MPRPWEYEPRESRSRRLSRGFVRRAHQSGFHESVRGVMRARGLDPDLVPSLSTTTVDRLLVDRRTIREVVPESDVRPVERALKPKEPPSPVTQDAGRRRSPSGKFIRDVLAEHYPGHEDEVEVEYVPGRGTIFTLNGVPRLFPELSLTIRELHGRQVAEDVTVYGPDRLPDDSPLRGAVSSPAVDILKGAGKALELAVLRDIDTVRTGSFKDDPEEWSDRRRELEEEVGLQTMKETASILSTLEPLDVPRKEIGKPVASAVLEPLALAADAAEAISPVGVPVTGGQIRGGLSVEIMSYITDPLNVLLFAGTAISGAGKLARLGTRASLTLKESQALRKAVPKARKLLVEEAGGRPRPPKPPSPRVEPVELPHIQVVRESDEVKALRARVVNDGIDPPPPPPPRLPGEPPPLFTGGQAPSTSLWRTIESGLFLSPRASNMLRRTAEVIGDAPGVRLFFKAITGPAALARVYPEMRAGVVYRRLQGIMDAELGQRLVGQEEAFNKLFTLGQDTSKVVIGGKEVAFGDYATDVLMGTRIGAPRARFPVTATQREWITTQKSLMDDIARQYEHVSGEELRVLPDFWPRFVLDDTGRVSIKGRIGAKQSPVKERIFREMEESIARGTPYASPAETVQLYGRAVQKMIRDKLLIKVIKEDKIGKPVITQLRQQIKALKAQIKAARPANLDELDAVEVLRNKVSNLQAIVAARRRTLIPAKQVLGPGFGKELLEPEAAKVMQEIIGPGLGGKPGKGLRVATYVSSIPRFVVTGAMDVGQFFLQGATLLGTDPASWGRAVGHSLTSLFLPEHWSRYLARSPEAMEAARYGIGRGGIEFLEITKRSAALGRAPGAGVIKAVLGAAPRSFETFIEGSRIFNFSSLARIQRAAVGKAPKGVLPTLERAAAGVSKGELEGELIRISNYVKTKLGTTDMMGLGLSVTQRQVESAFLLYSPRYTRSVFGMLGWALSNGVPARDAQRALATMLFGGMSSFYGFARATGLSHDETASRMNPAAGGKFLSLSIGGNEYGFGSSYRATLGFLGQLLKEDSWDFGSWEEAAFDNPLARYLRSRTAPTTGTLVDFIEGEDFMGQDVSLDAFIEDPSRLLDYAQDRFLPLNLEALLEARGPLWQKVLAGLTETVGGRAFPRSPFSLFQEAQEQVFREKKALGESPYKDFDSYEDMAKVHSPAASVIDTDPRVQQAQERLERESRFKKETTAQVGFKKLEETRALQREEQLENDAALRDGEITAPIWRDDFRNRQREFFARRIQIAEDFKLKFGADREGVNAVIEDYFNVNVDDYPSIVDGGTDWDRFFTAKEEVLATLSSADRRLVDNYLHRFDTPTVKEFRGAQDALGEYWAIEDLLWNRVQEKPEFADFPTFNDYLTAKAQALLDTGVPVDEVSRTLSRLAVVSSLTSAVAELRFRHRIANPDIDALLVKWYGLVPAKEQRRTSSGGRPQRPSR